jgi:hypothetical protein
VDHAFHGHSPGCSEAVARNHSTHPDYCRRRRDSQRNLMVGQYLAKDIPREEFKPVDGSVHMLFGRNLRRRAVRSWSFCLGFAWDHLLNGPFPRFTALIGLLGDILFLTGLARVQPSQPQAGRPGQIGPILMGLGPVVATVANLLIQPDPIDQRDCRQPGKSSRRVTTIRVAVFWLCGPGCASSHNAPKQV